MTNWYDTIVSNIKSALESVFAKKSDLSTVATTGKYNDLIRPINYETDLVFDFSGKKFVTGQSDIITGTNLKINWGDGTIESFESGSALSHTYASNGIYKIIVTGDTITRLGGGVFHLDKQNGQGLLSLNIPEGVTSLGTNTLDTYMYYLEKVVIPSSLTDIGRINFYNIGQGLSNPPKIIFKGKTPPIATSDSFYHMPTNCILYVPSSALNSYKSASNYPNPSNYTYVGLADEVIDSIVDGDTRGVTSNAVYDYAQPKGSYLTSSDIKDNLSSTDTDKPLSANQGKVLKDEIGSIHDLIYGVGE